MVKTLYDIGEGVYRRLNIIMRILKVNDGMARIILPGRHLRFHHFFSFEVPFFIKCKLASGAGVIE